MRLLGHMRPCMRQDGEDANFQLRQCSRRVKQHTARGVVESYEICVHRSGGDVVVHYPDAQALTHFDTT